LSLFDHPQYAFGIWAMPGFKVLEATFSHDGDIGDINNREHNWHKINMI
jgi:hypothetical protein